jgi:hypothetical protein
MFVPGFAPPRGPNSHRTGKNHYEPMILYSTKDWIRIKYLSVGPNAEHEKVIQLITEHCDGNYTETIRAELGATPQSRLSALTVMNPYSEILLQKPG